MKADCSNLYLKSMTYTFYINDVGYQVAVIFTLEIPVYEAVTGLHLVTPQSKPRESYWRELPQFYTCRLY